MPSPADRAKQGIEDWFTKRPAEDKPSWSERLFGWFFNLIGGGIYNALERAEPGAIEHMKPLLMTLRDSPGTTPEMKQMYDKALETGNPISVIAGALVFPIMAFTTLLGGSTPMANLLRYGHDWLLRTSRLDPHTAITAWRRDYVEWEYLLEDLREQGWSEDRIRALKFTSLAYPTPQEAITMMAHEAFEEGMVAKYQLDDEFEGLNFAYLLKVGIDKETAKYHWRSHWIHPSWGQIVEMLHRGLITEQDVREWFRLVEIPPFWRDMMIKTAYTWPTRVDVRRFYDLQTIDDARLREIYMGMGYRDQNLEDYILWTKIYVRLPDLLARWKNGWITLDQVKSSLVGYGMKPEAAQELIETKVKATEPTTTTEVKKLTIAMIIRWVKLDEATRRPLGVELLQDLDYTEPQAEFIMEGYLGEMGSPETFEDFKNLTLKYRQAMGLEGKPMSEELKQAASDLAQATKDLELLKEELVNFNAGVIDVEPIPENILQQRVELEEKVANAELQLAYTKSRYETELAKWRATPT